MNNGKRTKLARNHKHNIIKFILWQSYDYNARFHSNRPIYTEVLVSVVCKFWGCQGAEDTKMDKLQLEGCTLWTYTLMGDDRCPLGGINKSMCVSYIGQVLTV